MASSSSSSQPRWKYDVFLSFRGEDTRYNFTSHLFAALQRHGIHTFMDDARLEKGEDVSTELLNAIADTRISVIVFSKRYAESSWCLDELVKIMECRETLQQIVLPIFHQVYPSEVRAQKGSFEKAFVKHKERFKEGLGGNKLEKWRKALSEAANLSGWDLQNAANRDEAKVIEKIVEKVEYELDRGPLSVAYHPVGLEHRVQELKMKLSMESNDVRVVAVWGMGGIGKTTIAKRLYNLIHRKFEGSSFLADVRETLKQPNALVNLQERLLSDIVGSETHCINDKDRGIEILKRRALFRKVLIVLDDVDNFRQLMNLAISRDSFGSGSRIIITTRDMSSLNFLEVDESYTPELLDIDESLQLFSWYAFKENHPVEDYADLSRQVVHYAGGLPLALEVLGCFLCKRNASQWEDAIARLKKIPHDDILGKLKISFDSLSKEEKELFLDIAFFFVGMDLDFTITILKGCNLYPVIGFQVLFDRCLIKYKDCNNQIIVMHDMLRDMGREIVRQESEKEPGKRSRLWYHEDALEVLREATGTESVEGFSLNLLEPKDVQVHEKAFEKMNKLRLLHLNYIRSSAGYEHFPRKLVWLCWNGFSLTCLPSNLLLENLVALDLCYSSLKLVWKGTMILGKLKFLYLSHCYNLTTTPDFSGLGNLEKLLLNDCTRLVEVHESIECLSKLLVLDFKNCRKLRKLPLGFLKLNSLEFLDLSGCSELGILAEFRGSPSRSPWYSRLSCWVLGTSSVDSIGLSLASTQGLSSLKTLNMARCNLSHLPGELGNLVTLVNLDLGENNLHTLPDSIGNLSRLQFLSLGRNNTSNLMSLPDSIGNLTSLVGLELDGNNHLCSLPNSIGNLTSLRKLSMSGCNVSHLPSEIGGLISLVNLDLTGNSFCSLPDSISNLTWLKYLLLDDCARLQSIPELPVSLEELTASNCASLEKISVGSNWSILETMDFLDCPKLVTNEIVNDFRKSLENKELSELKKSIDIVVPPLAGGLFPNWLEYQNTAGSHLSLVVPLPPLVNQKIHGLFFCTVSSDGGASVHGYGIRYSIFNKTKGSQHYFDSTYNKSRGNDLWICCFIPLNEFTEMQLQGGDEVEISAEVGNADDAGGAVKQCGVSFIYRVDENTTITETIDQLASR